MDTSKSGIGQRIRVLREKGKLTQKELADFLQVKRETVNFWENGYRDLKTEYTVTLANFFDVTCDYILRGIDSKNVDICFRTGLSEEAVSALETNVGGLLAHSEDDPLIQSFPAMLNVEFINAFIVDRETTIALSNLAGKLINLRRGRTEAVWKSEDDVFLGVHRKIAAFYERFVAKHGDKINDDYVAFMKSLFPEFEKEGV